MLVAAYGAHLALAKLQSDCAPRKRTSPATILPGGVLYKLQDG